MSILQLNGVCPAILIGLDEILSRDPNRFATRVGGIQSLLDPLNTQGVTIQQEAYRGDGHELAVRVMHKQRSTVDDIGDEKTCDPGSEKPRFEEVFQVTQHNEHAFQVKESTIRALCSAWSNWVALGRNTAERRANPMSAGPLMVMREMAEDIILGLDAFRTVMNRKFLTAVASHIGAYANQSGTPASKSFNMIKTADNSLVLAGFNQFQQELDKIGTGLRPLVFGGGNLDLAVRSMQWGCCNDAGIDFGKMNAGSMFQFYKDYEDFSTYFEDANSFIAYLPKTIQFVNFVKYIGDFAGQIGTMQRGTITDPVLGIDLDVRIQPDECGELYNLWVNSDFDFYFAPDNMFKSGDRLEGVNGIVEGIALAV